MSVKYSISVLPNGISFKNAVVGAKFSLVFGIVPTTSNSKNLLTSTQAYNQITALNAELLKSRAMTVKTPNVSVPFPFSNDFFSKDQLKLWEAYFDKTSFRHDDYQLGKASFADIKKEPFFDRQTYHQSEDLSHDVRSLNYLGKRVEAALSDKAKLATEISMQAADTQLRLLESEKRYQWIDEHGREQERILAAKRMVKSTEKNLTDFFNYLYQHPIKAREYGLIYDFVIEDPRFISEYFNEHVRDFFVQPQNVEVSGLDAGLFYTEPVEISTTTCTVNGKTRHFHGLNDFGIIQYSAENFFFSTTDPDKELQHQQQFTEALKANLTENKRVPQLTESVASSVEGIYLNRKLRPDGTMVTLQLPNSLGLNVYVLKENAKIKNNWSSLCKRDVTYQDKNGRKSLPEEGWITPQLTTGAGAKNYENQSVFIWKGLNLCLAASKPSKDPQDRLNDSENKQDVQRGGFEGFNENGEIDVLNKNGFEFSYKAIPSSNVFLERGYNYHFLLRNVQVNNYIVPIESTHEAEMSVRDLLDSKPEGMLFPFSDFNLKAEPISSVVLLPENVRNRFSRSESETDLVILNQNAQSARYIYPPKINLKLAFMLGLFSNAQMRAKSRLEYGIKTAGLITRSKKVLPEAHQGGTISYLSDIRGRQLRITPADWHTMNYFNDEPVLAEFFKYQDIENYFAKTKAVKLLLTGNKNAVTVKFSSGDLNVALPAGLRLSFNLQLVENETFNKKMLSVKTAKFTSLFLDETFGSYPKLKFSTTHAIKLPLKPALLASRYEVQRTNFNSNADYVFCGLDFSAIDIAGTKNLQLVSKYTTMRDDGVSIPEPGVLKDGKDRWLDENRTDRLLKNEYPSSVFAQQVGELVENVIYPNMFGFSFQLPELLETYLVTGDVLLELKFTSTTSLKIIYVKDHLAEVIYTGRPAFGTVNILEENLIRIQYVPQLRLRMKVQINQTTHTFEADQLPIIDLHYKHLEVLEKVEQVLLTSLKGKYHIRYDHKAENTKPYFICYPESETSSVSKIFKVRAVSSFQDVFDKEAYRNLFVDSNECVINVVNHLRPKKPVFTMKSLLFHEKTEQSRLRSSQIMFEIDRPLANEEDFILILSEVAGAISKITPMSSAVGRDIASFQDNFSANTELNVLLTKKSDIKKPYLFKYLKRDFEKENHFTSIDDKLIYHYLPLKPFFDVVKNKWIAVIDLSESVLHNFYNPFIKIVAALRRYNSLPELSISEFSAPKYMNLLSNRQITFSTSLESVGGHKVNLLNITVNNIAVIKRDAENNERTVFVVCCRDLSAPQGINGNIQKVRAIKDGHFGNASDYNRLANGIISIELLKNVMVSVYEYEMFDNSSKLVQDWFNEPSFRMIYMEEFRS